MKIEKCYFCDEDFDIEEHDNSGYLRIYGEYVPVCAGCREDYQDYVEFLGLEERPLQFPLVERK